MLCMSCIDGERFADSIPATGNPRRAQAAPSESARSMGGHSAQTARDRRLTVTPQLVLLRAVSVVTLAEDDVTSMADAAAADTWWASRPAQEDMLALWSSLRRQLARVESLLLGDAA